MGSVSVSSCRCCMFVSCVHPVAVLNAAFCITCSLLMLVDDAIGDHTEEAYSRAGLITALYVAWLQTTQPTGSKRHSIQAVKLSQRNQTAVQIVPNLPAPSNEGPIYRFFGMPVMRTRWIAGAVAHKSG